LLAKLYGFNAELIEKHVTSISHEQSLKPLGKDGNSLNWTLGHIVSSRYLVFKHLPTEHVWTDEERVRYRNGSPNVTADGEGVLPISTLLSLFQTTQEQLQIGLDSMSYEQMNLGTGFGEEKVGDWLAYMQFHEAHHVGQLMSAAQAVGHPGAWLDWMN